MKKLIVFVGLFFATMTGLKAQDFLVSLDKDTILIGDHITLKMELYLNEGESGFFPQLSDSSFLFDLIETYPMDTIEQGLQQKYLLTQFEAGRYELSNFPALILRTNGAADTIYSNSLILQVNTVSVDTSKAIKPIKQVKSLPFPWKQFMKKLSLWLIPILIILGLILWYFLRKKEIIIFKEKPKTMLDFYHEALDELQELDNQKLWQNDKVKDYYLGLSEILRAYIEGRFEILAMESTTDEIKEILSLNDSLKGKVCEILIQADLAKFAKFRPLGDENMRMMKMAKDFVRHTKPKKLIEKDDV
jgi:hypothetical protein